jgi:hypothetical protein
MIDCRYLRSDWSRFRFNELPEAEAASLRQHLAECCLCRQYDRQMQLVVQTLHGLSGAGRDEPDATRIEQLLRKAQQRYRLSLRSRQALAATLLAGFIGGAVFWAAFNEVRQDPGYPLISHAQTITLPAAGVKNVSLAIDSDRALDAVTFTIELPDGVELDGYPGQRSLSWQGQLQDGLNRLTLPLLTQHQAHAGVLKARIEYLGGGRELILPLKPTGGSAARPGSDRGLMHVAIRRDLS